MYWRAPNASANDAKHTILCTWVAQVSPSWQGGMTITTENGHAGQGAPSFVCANNKKIDDDTHRYHMPPATTIPMAEPKYPESNEPEDLEATWESVPVDGDRYTGHRASWMPMFCDAVAGDIVDLAMQNVSFWFTGQYPAATRLIYHVTVLRAKRRRIFFRGVPYIYCCHDWEGRG